MMGFYTQIDVADLIEIHGAERISLTNAVLQAPKKAILVVFMHDNKPVTAYAFSPHELNRLIDETVSDILIIDHSVAERLVGYPNNSKVPA